VFASFAGCAFFGARAFGGGAATRFAFASFFVGSRTFFDSGRAEETLAVEDRCRTVGAPGF
jgi:hypothetical protein